MIGLPQRRVAAAAGAQAPVVYPADYCVFGRYWIGRTSSGGYQLGSLTAPTPIFDGSVINYDNRNAQMLARTVPENDRVFIFCSSRDASDKTTVIRNNQVRYFNEYILTYESQYAENAPNGAAMRTAFGMSGSWRVGITTTRRFDNDLYLYEGSTSFPFSFQCYDARVSLLKDDVRQIAGGSTTYQLLSSEQTGTQDYVAGTRFLTDINRIIATPQNRSAPIWTWNINHYTGTLADGLYTLVNGNLVLTSSNSNFLPSHEIRTFSNEQAGRISSTGSVTGGQGDRITRAASLEASPNYLRVPIPTSGNLIAGFGRDDTSADINPIWSLYGGAVRINYQRQVSVNGGPWYVPRDSFQSPVILSLGDRWVRDLAPFIAANPGAQKNPFSLIVNLA